MLVVEMHDSDHPVEVAEAPGREAKARDAEEGVEDLGVDLEPDFAGGGVGVGSGVIHGGGGFEEEEEEHCAPCLLGVREVLKWWFWLWVEVGTYDDVQEVDCDEKS